MKKHLLSLLALLAVSIGMTACDTLGPLVGNYKNQLESIVGVTVAGKYTVTVTRDGRAIVTETWECTTDGQKLTGCHKVASMAVGQ